MEKQSRKKTLGQSVPVRNVQIDACSCEGIAAISNLDPRVDVWVASGSVLCGQVGDWYNSEATLSAMAASLKRGGFMIITGFTQSFLHPVLLHKLQLRVLQGSLPSNEAGGLESGFQRFHMFVLVKDGDGRDGGGGGGGGGGCENEEDKVLRQFMLGKTVSIVGGDRALRMEVHADVETRGRTTTG